MGRKAPGRGDARESSPEFRRECLPNVSYGSTATPSTGHGSNLPEELERLPEVRQQVTADESKLECPALRPWYLVGLHAGLCLTKASVVWSAFFFILAAPNMFTPKCWRFHGTLAHTVCTAQTLCFWTYPVVCCMFVPLVYLKNIFDARVYYEFLLHGVLIGYERQDFYYFFTHTTINIFLVYAMAALSTIFWDYDAWRRPRDVAMHMYGLLAYVTPVISFLVILYTRWSVQWELVTLPNFFVDHTWAMDHLNRSRHYTLAEVKRGYCALENCLQETLQKVSTPHLVALVEHYAAAERNPKPPARAERQDSRDRPPPRDTPEWLWAFKLTFNPRLVDDRAWEFRCWASLYLCFLFVLELTLLYVVVQCVITCMEMERVITPESAWFPYTRSYTMRADEIRASMDPEYTLEKDVKALLLVQLQHRPLGHGIQAQVSSATDHVHHHMGKFLQGR